LIPNGAKAFHDGDFAVAFSVYQSAINDPRTRCEALYQSGVVAVRARQVETAESAFSSFLGSECANDAILTFRALVMRAEVRRTLKRNADALADYQKALTTRPGLLDSYLYERIADLTGDTALLQKAAESPRYLAGEFFLRNKVASQYMTSGTVPNAQLALAQYEAILRTATRYTYRAEVEVNAARAELAYGAKSTAYARLQRVIATFTDAPAALQALILLVNEGQPVDLVLRTRINVKNGNHPPVIALLSEDFGSVIGGVTPFTPSATFTAELLTLFGIAQRETGVDLTTTIRTFTFALEKFPNDPQAPTAWMEIAATYAKAKQYATAINTYITLVNQFPTATQSPEALWQAATLTQTHLDAQQSFGLYQQLASRFPTHPRAVEGAFRAGFALSKTDPRNAAGFFGLAGDARGKLWQGKMLQRAGDTSGARGAWGAAFALEPNSFWGLRGRDLSTSATPYQGAASYTFTFPIEADLAAADTWFKSTFGLPITRTLPLEISSDGRLTRGTELWALGWLTDARAEFDALHEAKRDDPSAMIALAAYYQGIGVYRSSQIAGTRVALLSKQPFTQVPLYILRFAFPVYYADLVAKEAKDYNLDPAFFAALIRLESQWDAYALSVSEARGLTQVIPSTANDILGRLKFPENFVQDDLYRPLVSLRYGAYYVDFTRRFLGGNLAATLAGYNAGPGAARAWLTQSGDDLDMFYETITSGQAKDYVRYTYENFNVYRMLYGGR
jgi:soluble lytic murein transglycosylase